MEALNSGTETEFNALAKSCSLSLLKFGLRPRIPQQQGLASLRNVGARSFVRRSG